MKGTPTEFLDKLMLWMDKNVKYGLNEKVL